MAEWESWLEIAESDLAAAKSLGQAGFYSHACFQCQQAVEKALKALLLFKHDSFPKTHSLPELAKLAGVFDELREPVSTLDSAYASARYAGASGKPPVRAYDKAAFDAHIVQAERAIGEIIKWIRG